jgi:hypothetical protein
MEISSAFNQGRNVLGGLFCGAFTQQGIHAVCNGQATLARIEKRQAITHLVYGACAFFWAGDLRGSTTRHAIFLSGPWTSDWFFEVCLLAGR